MKRHFFLLLGILVFFGLLVIPGSVSVGSDNVQDIKAVDLSVKPQDSHSQLRTGTVQVDLDFGKFPLYFITNKGQVNKKAAFYAKTSRYTLWLTKEGLVFDSMKSQSAESIAHSKKSKAHKAPTHSPYSPHSPKTHRDVSRLLFLDANKNPVMVPIEETKLRVNYFIGNDQSKWHCDVPTSQVVLYKNLYKNIDLKVYGIEKQIEYDWIVKPGGNPGDIRFEYKNVKGTRLDDEGNLLIETEFGELIHKKPVSYQEMSMGQGARSMEKEEGRRDVEVQFKKIGKNSYGFDVGQYDKNRELIIDPVVLAYSTYLGGGLDETGYGTAVDNNGNVYVTGYTHSIDFPLLNQYQGYYGGGNYDVFVSRIDTNQSGSSSLIYSTYLGGNVSDYGRGIAVDSSGNAYVTGFTLSSNFPTLNQYQANPGATDVFVTKLDTNQAGTSSLIYSTYLGGTDYNWGCGVAVDSNGYVYVTGYTDSTDFPTLNQYQTDQLNRDAFLTKIDPTQSGTSSLIYSTYLGGSCEDYGYGIAVDSSGNAYVTGETVSTDFPTLNQYQADQDQENNDAFVTRIDTNQSGASCLIYSTYLGGSSGDHGTGIAVDGSGNAYVTGGTSSTDFPTLNQYQVDQISSDAFVTKIDTNQSGTSSLIYSTYLGGGGWENSYGIAADENGIVYVTGATESTDFPCLDQYQANQGDRDPFVTKIDTNQAGTSSLIYSTYLGGNGRDHGYGIAVDSSGCAYVTGYTNSIDFPTLNHYQTDPGDGYYDAFITKLFTAVPPTVTTSAVSSITAVSAVCGGNITDDGGTEVTVRGVCWSTSENPTTDDCHTNDGSGTGIFDSFLTNLIPNTVYYVRAYATNAAGTAYGDEMSFETLDPSITVTSPNGGESWEVGSSHTITWTSDGVDGNVKIDYSTNNGQNWTEITASTLNDGIHSWEIPDEVSNQCLIRVSETDGSPSDTSDNVFTIFPPTITVTSPNGGENWEVNSQQTINWYSIGTVGNIKIEYSTNNGDNWTEIAASTENDGTHPWTVPGTVSNQCLIRVSETDGSPSDTSNNVFIIFSPGITVTSPNGGENLEVGSVYDITWTSQGTIGNVMIEYSTNGGSSWRTLVESTENDGSYNWNVPATPSGNCLVRVSENDEDGGPSDVSDAVFSIVSTASGSITIRFPNGGETWLAGSTQEIKWNSTGDINYVNIKYSKDNGITWKTIAKNAVNNHSYNWVVPGTVSDKCLVRVTANDNDLDPKPSDVSDAVFSIVLPPTVTIEVIAPNGGEQLTVDSQFTITWNTANTREDVRIEYSVNGGDTWREITGAAENNGKYDWIVPDEPSDNCLVRISETGGQASDESDTLFSIASPSSGDITVTSPNGGETWEADSPQEIKWTSSGGIDGVKIEYSRDNGTTWKTIVQTTPNSGSFAWTVPDIASDECLVRITSNDVSTDPIPSDISDAVFSIVPPASPAIKVITPNGGEQLPVGSQYDITWFSRETREAVKIEYSANGGDPWVEIVNATENDGKYEWIVPDTPSETCLVRVSETDGQPLDISDAVFSIVEPAPGEITVTSPNGSESWAVGSLQEIKWTAGGINNVTIEYSTDYGTTWKEIVQTTENDGSYDWTVPDPVSDECLVRVSSNDGDPDPKPSDTSDRVFSIVPDLAGEFRVTSPNGGEEWEVGSTQTITWTGTGDINTVMIEYSYDNGNTWNIIVPSVGNSGAYDWQLPDTVSDECLVRVTANDGDSDPRPSDVSDAVFSIVPPASPTIRVITPNGGEQLVIGSIYEITWFGTDSRADVKIEYSINGGETWTEIIGSTENDGDYDWLVPDEPSEICLVRISDLEGQPVDVSDAVFSIVQPLPGDLTVLTPNGGENLETGSEYNISWTSSGLNNVIIEYSVNNGATWLYIDKVPADNGSYTWTVPGTPSEMCLVRVIGADADENPLDVSDEVFTIFDPLQTSIEVFTPNGGESLSVGEEYYITWASSGINSVKIEYSTDNGDQWIPIDTVPAIGGRFTWTVPDTPSDSCLIRITGNDSPGDPSDVSDSVFSITSN